MEIELTKVSVPATNASVVARARLHALLDALSRRLLVGVVTPPGFGKTTLLGGWARSRAEPVAWLSLDESDDAPGRFVRGVCSALQRADRDLQLPDPSGMADDGAAVVPGIWSPLINELAVSDRHYLLVLDDLHQLRGEQARLALQKLVERAPANLHLVAASREPLPLALGRLRAQDDLVMVEAEQLRFSIEEADTLLNAKLGLNLTPADVERVWTRVDGWPAGLRLAALTLEGSGDPTARLDTFGGDDRNVADYLGEEVFRQLPERRREFLLQTSLLERMTPALCDHLTGRRDATRVLAELERRNLFVSRFDAEQGWYRYHPLMSGFLRHLLATERPEAVTPLHREAARWFAANGRVDDAVRHAIAGRDAGLLESLLDAHCEAFLQRGQAPLVRGWLDQLDEDFLASRPWLAARLAWSYAAVGSVAEIEARIGSIERTLTGAASPVAAGRRDETRRYLAGLEVRALRMQGRSAAAISACRKQLAGPPAVPSRLEGSLHWTLGEALLDEGRVSEAVDALGRAREIARQVGYPPLAQVAAARLARCRRLAGDLGGAVKLCEDECLWAERHAAAHHASHAFVLAELTAARVEMGTEAATAHQALRRVLELALPGARSAAVTAHITAARLELIRDARRRAVEHADAAVELARSIDFHDVLAGARAFRAWLAVMLGDLDAAERWVRTRAVITEGGFASTRDRLVTARLHLAAERPSEACALAAAAEQGARECGWWERVMLARLYRALALRALGREGRARQAMVAALRCAERGGFARTFVEESGAAAGLLQAVIGLAEGDASAAVRRHATRLLRMATEETSDVVARYAVAAPTNASEADADDDQDERFRSYLSDPLTVRERELLVLVAEGLSNQHIADRLGINLNTVKGHLKHIFAKLDVHSRTHAVARARRWRLLPT